MNSKSVNRRMQVPRARPPHDSLYRRLSFGGFWIAMLAVIVAVAAGFGTRVGLWNFRAGFSILRWSGYFALVAAIVTLCMAVISARARMLKAFAVSLIGFCCSGALVGELVNWQLRAWGVPPIHDITTDTNNPPKFVDILPLRRFAANPPEYGGPAIAAQQRAAYPDLKTLIVDLPGEQAFGLALETARRLGWHIVAAVQQDGRIEATDTTFWFGFTDDIVVRITPAGDRSLVDIRSVSRVGLGDAGTNAARIRRFLHLMTVPGQKE